MTNPFPPVEPSGPCEVVAIRGFWYVQIKGPPVVLIETFALEKYAREKAATVNAAILEWCKGLKGL